MTMDWVPARFGWLRLELPPSMAEKITTPKDVEAGESLTLLLNDLELGRLELTMETASASPRHLRQQLRGLTESLAARGVELSKLRSRARPAAGLAGEEVAVSTQQGAVTHGIFIWYGAGQLGGIEARVALQLSVSGDALDPKLELWDHLLNSLTHESAQ